MLSLAFVFLAPTKELHCRFTSPVVHVRLPGYQQDFGQLLGGVVFLQAGDQVWPQVVRLGAEPIREFQ